MLKNSNMAGRTPRWMLTLTHITMRKTSNTGRGSNLLILLIQTKKRFPIGFTQKIKFSAEKPTSTCILLIESWKFKRKEPKPWKQRKKSSEKPSKSQILIFSGQNTYKLQITMCKSRGKLMVFRVFWSQMSRKLASPALKEPLDIHFTTQKPKSKNWLKASQNTRSRIISLWAIRSHLQKEIEDLQIWPFSRRRNCSGVCKAMGLRGSPKIMPYIKFELLI